MGWIIFIVAIIVIVLIMFNTDKTAENEKIQKMGGVDKMYPNFAMYIKFESLSMYGSPELVMKAGGKMEYKKKIVVVDANIGDFHFSLNHTFKGWIESYFITKYGVKIKGHIVEIKSGLNELNVEGYGLLLDKMLINIFKLPEFRKYASQLENMGDFVNNISSL